MTRGRVGCGRRGAGWGAWARGRLQSALLGLFEPGDQGSKSRIANVSTTANEERRGSVDTALDATHEVFPNACEMDMLSHLLLEALHVQLDFLLVVGEESVVS